MIKKFHAQTTRDALRQVRDALGADALILSNRQVAGGVEIIAVADMDMVALAAQAEPALWRDPPTPAPAPAAPVQIQAVPQAKLQPQSKPQSQPQPQAQSHPHSQPHPHPQPHPQPQPQPRPRPVPTVPPAAFNPPPFNPPPFNPPPSRSNLTLDDAKPQLATLADYLAERDVSSLIRPSPSRQAAQAAQAKQAAQTAQTAHGAKPALAATPFSVPVASEKLVPAQEDRDTRDTADAVDDLAREMRLMRGMVEGQLAGFAWNDLTRRDPIRLETMKRLLAAGFSASFSRLLLERLPSEETDLARALKWIKSTIAHNLKLAGNADDIVERGGVYALVGPTGVGKTTTVAKLAARAVLRHGASKIALVTTDTYRIGAQDQLRIYGRILGTPVFAVRDENDLEMTLSDLSGRHLVFVDTVGMSQRDKRLSEQVALLCGEQRDVKRLLLLGAPSQGVTLEEVARAYSGPGLIGCVLTKIDEALTYGPVLDVAIRHELPLHYVTNGQRVPEDLHLANAVYLVDRAFRINQQESPFTQDENDYPILMAAAMQTAEMPGMDDVGVSMGGRSAAR
jgi:flagellar biosynthesis protein FlhF